MDVGIIVYSNSGHTLSVAGSLKERLADEGHSVVLTQLETVTPLQMSDTMAELVSIPPVDGHDALVLACPVRGGTQAPPMRVYLEQVPSLAGKAVACLVIRVQGKKGLRMKTIGLLGGMSWESTALYYRLINEAVNRRLGGLHSARIVMVSVDFEPIEVMQTEGDWEAAGTALAQAARQVEAAGADFLVICTNTMHKVAPTVQDAIGIPLLHIADATAQRIKEAGIGTVGLLGTNFTMEQDFYKGRLVEEYGLNVLVPPKPDRDLVHHIIYDELCLGVVDDASRRVYLRIIEDLRARGAEGIIEGCTEIVMLVQQAHTEVPLFDTTSIHAEAAVLEALG